MQNCSVGPSFPSPSYYVPHPFVICANAERIDSIQLSDIHATARRWIIEEDHALAAVGPIENLPDYDSIRKMSQGIC